MLIAFVTTQPTPAAKAPSNANATEATKHTDGSHCTLPIPSEWLTCKISLKNDPSIKLFESLGFTRQSVSEIWQEVEMRFTDTNQKHLSQFGDSIRQTLFWSDE